MIFLLLLFSIDCLNFTSPGSGSNYGIYIGKPPNLNIRDKITIFIRCKGENKSGTVKSLLSGNFGAYIRADVNQYRWQSEWGIFDSYFPPDIYDGDWHTVAYTYDSAGSSDNCIIQIDGYSIRKDTKIGYAWDGYKWWIGTRNGNAYYFDGKISEIQIYNRVLDSTEIAWLNNNPDAVYDATDLHLWYPMNEGSGNTVYDYSFYGNHGSIRNGVEWDSCEYNAPHINYNFASSKLYAFYGSVIAPSGICKGDTTYIVWENNSLDPEIIMYNDAIHQWSESVIVGDNPLNNDDHGNPSMIRDKSGYLYVFYGCHNRYLMMNKSVNPDDISEWGDQDTVITPCTYPKPIIDSNNNIWVFYRGSGASGNGELSYTKSTDGGDTWSPVTKLIEMDSVDKHFDSGYGSIALSPDSFKVHYSWVTQGPSGRRRNLYYAYFDLCNGNMYDINGNSLGPLIDRTEADDSCLIVNSDIDSTNTPQLHLFGNHPYIIFAYRGDTQWQQEFLYHNGCEWSGIDTICLIDANFAGRDFIIHSADSIEAYLTMDLISDINSERGGDIVRYDWNGSAWILTDTIMTRLEFCAMDFPKLIQKYNGGDVKLIFEELSFDCEQACPFRVFAWGSNGIVKRIWK